MELMKFKGLMMAYKLTNTNRKMTIISKTDKNSHIRTKTMSCVTAPVIKCIAFSSSQYNNNCVGTTLQYL